MVLDLMKKAMEKPKHPKHVGGNPFDFFEMFKELAKWGIGRKPKFRYNYVVHKGGSSYKSFDDKETAEAYAQEIEGYVIPVKMKGIL